VARHHFLTSRSRALRKNATDAERKLWSVLRGRQLNGLKFRKQVEIDGYVVDFLCAERRLIIEVDGGQHTPERDARRSAYLESQGFRLIRFWNDDVLQNIDGVWTMIEEALETTPPHPTR
jgi:very-short-patch-repair endonuclease